MSSSLMNTRQRPSSMRVRLMRVVASIRLYILRKRLLGGLAQSFLALFESLLLHACGFERERNLLMRRAQAMKSHVCLGPACAARSRSFNRVKPRFGFGSALSAFRLDLLKPRAVLTQLFLQIGRVRALYVGHTIEAALHQQKLALGICDHARGRNARGERLPVGVSEHGIASLYLFESLPLGGR